MNITSLEADWARLTLTRFDEEDALRLGLSLIDAAREIKAPVAINIRTPDRTLFHASLPGATPLNDRWTRRKSNLAFMFGEPSMLTTLRFRESGEDFARHGLDPVEFALSGGSVPVRLAGAGIVAAVTVSGLPEEEDHRMVVKALAALERHT